MGHNGLLQWNRALQMFAEAQQSDLSSRHIILLTLVHDTPGPHTACTISEELGISKPAVTRSLARLGAMGLIKQKRKKGDLRVKFIERTDEGAELLGRLEMILLSNAQQQQWMPAGRQDRADGASMLERRA